MVHSRRRRFCNTRRTIAATLAASTLPPSARHGQSMEVAGLKFLESDKESNTHTYTVTDSEKDGLNHNIAHSDSDKIKYKDKVETTVTEGDLNKEGMGIVDKIGIDDNYHPSGPSRYGWWFWSKTPKTQKKTPDVNEDPNGNCVRLSGNPTVTNLIDVNTIEGTDEQGNNRQYNYMPEMVLESPWRVDFDSKTKKPYYEKTKKNKLKNFYLLPQNAVNMKLINAMKMKKVPGSEYGEYAYVPQEYLKKTWELQDLDEPGKRPSYRNKETNKVSENPPRDALEI